MAKLFSVSDNVERSIVAFVFDSDDNLYDCKAIGILDDYCDDGGSSKLIYDNQRRWIEYFSVSQVILYRILE